jgi:hypothetical protein
MMIPTSNLAPSGLSPGSTDHWFFKRASRMWATLSLLMALLTTVMPQVNRVSQFYPNVATAVPYLYDYPIHNGFFLPDYTTYVHGETAATGSSIRALRKDASVILAAAINTDDSNSLNFYNHKMVSFGNMAAITQFKFDYVFPNFFAFDATYSNAPAHNNDLFRATVDTTSGMHFVSTLAAKIVFKYQDSDLNTVAGQKSYLDITTITVLNFLLADKMIFAGTDSLVKFVDKSSLAEVLSYTTTCLPGAAIVNVLYDGVHVPQTDAYFDVACDTVVMRFAYDSTTLTKKAQLGPYTGPVTNLLEFSGHNYLMVTYGNNIEIIKRSSYLASQGIQMLAINTINQNSIGCCELNKHRFTFSASVGVSATPGFAAFTVNLDFCSNYDGETCTECNSGYKLNGSEIGNVCITPDEYPPKFGAKGSLIAPCKDLNCDQCIEAFYKCEACHAPFFINMDSYECSDLANVSLFGKDLTNSSVIRRCTDTNCLYCKDNYEFCTLCQEEYFDLRKGVCVAKDSNLEVNRSWFNESESKGYIQFKSEFMVDPSKLYPTNLTFEVFDYLNESYTDYTDFTITGDPAAGLLVLSIKLQTSIYAGLIRINQTAKSPIFYNAFSYMAPTVELNISNVRQIRASTFFLLQSMEGLINTVLWIVVMLSTLIGSIYHPLFGTLAMRAVSMSNLMSHLDGPALHASDMYLDIVGKTSVPLKLLDNMLQTPADRLDCLPESNFRKRYLGYSSCSILDMYGKSLVFFSLAILCCLPLAILTYRKLKAHRDKVMKDIKTPISPGLPRWMLLNRWFGIQLISAIIYATSPIVLQYSFLSMLSGGTPIFAVVFGSFCVVLYLLLVYAVYRFIYFFLDLLHIQDLKSKPKTELTHEKSLSVEPLVMKKGTNIIMPKSVDGPVITKDGRIRVPVSLNDSKATNVIEEKNTSSLLDSSAQDSSILQATPDSDTNAIRIDLEVLKSRYGFLRYYVAGFKTKSSSSRGLFYYMPMIELICTLVSSYVVVRFSTDGLVQVYVVAIFELLSLLVVSIAQPFEKRWNYWVFAVYKILLGIVLLLKMFNFIVMPEEAARQKIIDTVLFFGAVIFLIYAVGVSLFAVFRGIIMLRNFKKHCLEEELLLEEERRQLKEKLPTPPVEKDKDPSVESKSVSGISDSPVRREMPRMQIPIDKIARANQLTLKNRHKMISDNKKLFENPSINEDVEAENKELEADMLNLDQPEPIKERNTPIVETVEVSQKKKDGAFTTVRVTQDKFRGFDQRMAIKPRVIIEDASTDTAPPQPSNYSIIEGSFSLGSRFTPNISLVKPKKIDRFASMLEDNKNEVSQESKLFLMKVLEKINPNYLLSRITMIT